MLKTDKGITLVALIITIIVLVILAAVSIAAVYQSKIVEYAVNGSIDYTQAAVDENAIMKASEKVIESGVNKMESIVKAGLAAQSTPTETTP